ncbi:MAG: hypothetical protein OXQ29_09530 [Rhodospirillaceae bacterium]|nr:hypothetical protein [Rhodospirillaceae bacterium]
MAATRNAALGHIAGHVLRSLVIVESDLIKSAAPAGRRMAAFRTAPIPRRR